MMVFDGTVTGGNPELALTAQVGKNAEPMALATGDARR